MKKLSLVFFAVALLGLVACSATTDDVAKADSEEVNQSDKRSKKSCGSGVTGSRLSRKCK